jgi:hypothetical protein
MADLGAIASLQINELYGQHLVSPVYYITKTGVVLAQEDKPVSILGIGDIFTSELVDGGNYRVFGTITEDGLPVSCPVLLYKGADTNKIYRVVQSDASGAYQFSNVAAGQYLVIARDPDKEWNAVCRDHVTATLM